jgi:DNA polymerase I
MKKLILIDGNSIMFRAYYATAYPGAKLMQTSSGIYTNALFAFVSMFEKIVDVNDHYVLVAFDTKEPTKRHLAYEGYKAGRIKMPEELIVQIPLINQYIEISGIKHYSKPGYEADDIIGTLAKQGQKEGLEVEVYSSDKDLLQLVDDHITVNLLKKGMKEVHRFDPAFLYETYGLNQHQMIDLKALMGDPSDNIPGVPGVGEKTAIKLLQTYETLDNLLSKKEEIQGKLGEKIKENEALAILSKSLVTIDTNASLDITFHDLIQKPTDKRAITQFYQSYDLHVFVKKMENQTDTHESWDPIIITNEQTLENILKKPLAIHFEFSDHNYHQAELWGIGLSDGQKHYFIDPEFAMSSMQLSLYLNDEHISKSIYDYKAVKVFLLWHQMQLHGIDFDLLLAAYLMNSHLGKEEFKRIVSSFDYEDILYDDVVYGKGAKKGLPEDPMIYQRHIASKAKAIHTLKPKLINALKEEQQLHLLNDIEIPLSAVLAHMEYEGIKVDKHELDVQKKAFLEDIEAVTKKIYELAGESFNISSPKQLGEILFEKLSLPSGKKTKTGYSTNVDVLNKLKNKHPIITHILDYRQLTKLYSTYVEGIHEALFDDDKVHTIYMQALTTTGRLSSVEPNLQNIPIRTDAGRMIRKFFVPSKPENLLLGCDYSQIELRILADVANVKRLIEAFNKDLDIHTITAQEVFHTDDVTSEQRRQAKAVNFGIIYGIGAWSLSEDIDVSPKEAQAFIDRYLEIYPEIKNYMDDIKAFAYDKGYVETIMKRRRYIPELSSEVFMQRAFGERTALNAPIQGSAADVLKKAMIDLYTYLKKHKKQSKILLQVHDELILEVPPHEVEEMKKVVPDLMEKAVKMKVALTTSCDVGATWYDLK